MVHPTVHPDGQQRPPDVEAEERRGIAHHEAEEDATALDLLEDEDRTILRLSAEVDDIRTEVTEATGGARVRARADYGNRAKLLVRHFATREAAAVDVATGLQELDALHEVVDGLRSGEEERRQRMDRVEKMSRGVQGMYLNTAQDFDDELWDLVATVRPQVEWELHDAIPALRAQLDPARCRQLFHSARYVARHAPTHVSPGGPRWYERAPVISRVVTVVQHLRDYPRATRDART